MHIDDLEVLVLAIPCTVPKSGDGFKGQDWSDVRVILVRVTTDTGLIGWGEAFGYGMHEAVCYTLKNLLAPKVKGADCTDIASLIADLRQPMSIYGQNGVLQYALSGLDIALWDLKSKAAGQPLHELLGTAGKTTLPVYSSLFRYGDPDLVAQRCSEVASEGFVAIKLHETTITTLKSARNTVSEQLPIMMDTNCPWDTNEAIAMARAMHEYEVTWLEEPVYPPNDFSALAQVQAEGGIPIACGENMCTAVEFEQVLANTPLRILQPSISKVGGVTEFMAAAQAILAADGKLMPHTAYFGPAYVANMHCLAALGCDSWVEWFDLELDAQPLGDAILPRVGKCTVPTGPGLGIEPDLDVLKDYLVNK